MKYSFILNQKSVIDNEWDNLTPNHLVVIDVVASLINCGIYQKIGDFTWISYELILNELPILRVKKPQIANYIKELSNYKLIEMYPNNQKVGRVYMKLGVNYSKYLFSETPIKNILEVEEKEPDLSNIFDTPLKNILDPLSNIFDTPLKNILDESIYLDKENLLINNNTTTTQQKIEKEPYNPIFDYEPEPYQNDEIPTITLSEYEVLKKEKSCAKKEKSFADFMPTVEAMKSEMQNNVLFKFATAEPEFDYELLYATISAVCEADNKEFRNLGSAKVYLSYYVKASKIKEYLPAPIKNNNQNNNNQNNNQTYHGKSKPATNHERIKQQQFEDATRKHAERIAEFGG